MSVREQKWAAPLYWEKSGTTDWCEFTLRGLRPLDLSAPVTHVSYFEADAPPKAQKTQTPRSTCRES